MVTDNKVAFTYKGTAAGTDADAITFAGDADNGGGSWAGTVAETTKGVAGADATSASVAVITGDRKSVV